MARWGKDSPRSDGSSLRGAFATGLVLFATSLALVECGGDGDGDEPKSLSIVATEPAKDSYRIEAPQSVEAGLFEIEFKNSGKLEREAQLIKVEGNHTTAPGATARITQRLEPGAYVIFDSGEPEGRDVEPHYKQGAVAELEVTGDATDASLPETDATVTATEYSFSSSGLKAGTNKVNFRNGGGQWHHLIVARMNPGSTIQDVRRFLTTEEGEPPIDPEENLEETAVIDGGEEQQTEVELEPGSYALLCFIPDRAGGPPHVAKGMISEAKVR